MAKDFAIGLITGLAPVPEAALARVNTLGIPTVQLQYPEAWDSAEGVQRTRDAAAANGIEITTVFCGFDGESYADIPTVQQTVGLVPEASRAARVAQTLKIADYAYRLGVSRVAAHIGFVSPEDASYSAVVESVQHICDTLAQSGQRFALETGQETAAELEEFLADVARPNLFVNFDPANMILYGNDEPIAATEKLFAHIDGVHCKDGTWPTAPGHLGEEKPFGEGDVDAAAWVNKLLQLGYRGTFTIEREISGEQQREDVARAVALLQSLLPAT
ncbi:MAG TPA: sugar phosphate isomerase/epimerase family protein [Abditibacteriaceae bacterium]|jgi:sugar phosphate isomerase/epimerase